MVKKPLANAVADCEAYARKRLHVKYKSSSFAILLHLRKAELGATAG
jgi:hypothetical protein